MEKNFHRFTKIRTKNQITLHTSTLTIFPLGLSFLNRLRSCRTALRSPFMTVWWHRRPKFVPYLVQTAIGSFYFTWDILLPYFLKLPCIHYTPIAVQFLRAFDNIGTTVQYYRHCSSFVRRNTEDIYTFPSICHQYTMFTFHTKLWLKL
jgi:hypothetical protein